MKGTMRKYTVVLLISGILIAGCSKSAPVAEDTPLVRSQTIAADLKAGSASYPGEVRGRYESQLAFQVSGKIIKRNVELGSVVHQGDILMQIDPKDIQQGVNTREAQVLSAQAQLRLARENLSRYQRLYEEHAISKAELDRYQTSYDTAEASLRQAMAEFSSGANQLGYSNLVADRAGVVASVDAESGQVVSAGQKVLTLVQDGEREIEISVPEHRLEELRKAKGIRVTFWALPKLSLEGKVREISPIAEKTTRTYKVRVSLLNPVPELQLGMTATVSVIDPDTPAAVVVPLSAVYQTGDSPSVWVIKDGIVSLRPIKTGPFGDGKVQVLEGVSVGETIVTAGVHKLRDGQKVRIAGDSQ